MLQSPGGVIFEGAQGVLLDQSFGFRPHTTWSNTTFANADALLDEAGFAGKRTRIGVLRTYFTRHGAGPMVTADESLGDQLDEPHNDGHGWAGRFRVGAFDAVAARYALEVVGGVDWLAVTHLDRLGQLPASFCTAYEETCALPIHCDQTAPSLTLPRNTGGGNQGAGDTALFSLPRYAGGGLGSGPSDCAEPFVYREDRVVAIRADLPTNLKAASERTARLNACRPIYGPAPTHDPDEFLRLLSAELHVPIGIRSWGPTAAQKQMHEPALYAQTPIASRESTG